MTALAQLPRSISDAPLIEVNASTFTATHLVERDTPYQAGHYPDDPIFPGVFTMETVLLAARHALGPVEIEHVERVRFVKRIVPGQQLRISARVDLQAARRWRVSAKCQDSLGDLVAEMTLGLALAGEEER